MYVDDGAIFSNAKNHQLSALNATKGLQEITAWLGRNGLKCDSDKTEFISFSPFRAAEHLVGRTVSSIHPRTSATTSYTVERSPLIRYLGIFIHERFDWTHHVTIMANRARSTVRALSILGNSIRGLDYANWRKLFHALVLPVLTYGFPLYSTQPRNKGLLDILQIAQNDMVRKMSGAFKTTPIIPLHYMMAIPPLPLTIKKLTTVFRLRIQRLPPSTLIRTITYSNPAADWHLSLNPPTALTRLLPEFFPPFFLPAPTYNSHWIHPQFRDHSAYKLTAETKEATKILISQPSPDAFHLFIRVLTIPSPPFAASFLLFRGQTLVHSGAASNPSRLRALFLALCNGLTYASLSSHVHIFLPDLSLSPYLFHFHKHPLLDLSYALRSLLTKFLRPIPTTTLTPTGTPSSGLDSRARQGSTLSRRSNNYSSSRSLPLPLSLLKPSSFVTGKMLMTFYVGMPVTGSPLFALTVNHPPFTKALSLTSIAALLPQLSNLPSTTPSRLRIRIYSDPTLATTPSVLSTHITLRHLHRSRNNSAMNASCATSLIPAPTDPHPSLPLPILRELHSHDLSGLVREVFDSGLVRVTHSGGTRRTMSCSDAPPFHLLDAGSSEPVPSTHTSLVPLMAQSNLATSNVPPTVSSALCPPVQTLLDW